MFVDFELFGPNHFFDGFAIIFGVSFIIFWINFLDLGDKYQVGAIFGVFKHEAEARDHKNP